MLQNLYRVATSDAGSNTHMSDPSPLHIVFQMSGSMSASWYPISMITTLLADTEQGFYDRSPTFVRGYSCTRLLLRKLAVTALATNHAFVLVQGFADDSYPSCLLTNLFKSRYLLEGLGNVSLKRHVLSEPLKRVPTKTPPCERIAGTRGCSLQVINHSHAHLQLH